MRKTDVAPGFPVQNPGGDFMTVTFRRIAMLGLCLTLGFVLTACNAPRGAGFRSEVLAAKAEVDANGQPTYDFAVFSVTRASLPLLTGWPADKTRNLPWINRVDQPSSLIITPGDMLKISIWDAEENSLLTSPGQRVAQLQDVQVGPDGRIFLPFVGNMKVSGMAPDTARARIQDMLLNTVPSAQVQLSVAPGRANTVTLASGVRQPGVYPLVDRNITLLSLIAQGGGVPEAIVNPRVKLFRGNTVYGISLDRLFSEPALDTTLRGGDRIVVEADDRYFLSLGAVTRESLYPFPRDQVSALDALSIMGGVSALRANPQAILILRDYPASAVRPTASADAAPDPAGPPRDRVVFTIDLTSADGLFSAGKFQIQSGDLVYVTESPLGTATSLIGIFSNLALARQRLLQ